MKYLGIDWGTNRIGLALADSETRLATPFKAVKNADEVCAVIKEEEIDEVIVGLPLTLRNESGENRRKVDAFISKLKNKTGAEIKTIDERLTTRLAKALPGDKKTKAGKDAISAMLILQGYLDGLTKH